MKIRQGFVSNSSSSSFVVGAKKGFNNIEDVDQKILAQFAVKILDCVVNNSDVIHSVEELCDFYGCDHDDKNLCEEVQYLREGGVLIVASADYDDHTMPEILRTIAKTLPGGKMISED